MARLVSLADFWQTRACKNNLMSGTMPCQNLQPSLSLSLSRSLSLLAAPLAPDNFAAGGAFFIEALKFPAQKFLTKLFIKVWPRGQGRQGRGRGATEAKDVKTEKAKEKRAKLCRCAKRHLWAWPKCSGETKIPKKKNENYKK